MPARRVNPVRLSNRAVTMLKQSLLNFLDTGERCIMWFDVAITLSCAGCGLVCGWIMCAVTGFDTDHYHETIEKRRTQSEGEEISAEQLRQVANKLREFATTMVDNVDAHQTRVKEVSEQLQEAGVASSEVVFAAVSQLIESNESMQSQLQSAKDRIQQQTMQIESAERRAETDALTQLPNRRAFDACLKRCHAEGPGLLERSPCWMLICSSNLMTCMVIGLVMNCFVLLRMYCILTYSPMGW